MEWKSLLELKELYIDFFKKKGHLNLESFSLVPKDDFSLLFINSGMAPMKKWFLGQEVPPKKRVVTAQRCIRTGDIDLVGKTDRHGTFFEMLGNFSFGDYFKREAIFFAYEFVVDVLKMPKEKLYVSVYEDDEETYSIWQKEVLIPPDHIVKLGKEDNFWEIGSGPCGPCSELYFDRGKEYGCGREDCKVGCECDRYIEFWNLVFSQYNNKGDGQYEELKQKNIDTGMGLERLAVIFQGVDSLFEVDTVKKILQKVCALANVEYKQNKEKDVLIRIITDHIRSIVYLICDGVLPANEGRGYVLKRLIRRAHKSGKKLGITGNFLSNLSGVVCSLDTKLEGNFEYINSVLKNEEEAFEKILKSCENRVFSLIEDIKQKKDIFIFKKSKEVFLKANADFLALEEEISGFFEILNMEINRFFSLVDSNEFYSNRKEYFKLQEELIKTKFFKCLDSLKELVELFGDLSSEKLNEIFFAEENMEAILKFMDDDSENLEGEKERISSIVRSCLEKVRDILVFLKEELNERVDRIEEFKTSSLLEFVLKITDIFKIELDVDVFLKKPEISSAEAFKLCDTYGMPFDILKEMAYENGVLIDEEGFFKLMQNQRKKAKESANFKDCGWENKEIILKDFYKTEFVGYLKLKIKTKVLDVLDCEKEEGFKLVVLEKTPIYPVGGGQVCDTGKIFSVENNEVLAEIKDCKKLENGEIIHIVKILNNIKKGDFVVVAVDKQRREAIKKNHTAAHLLQKALILHLGGHVRQKGQLVDESRVRFDFAHYKALEEEDLRAIEEIVNFEIFKKDNVMVFEMEKEKAKEEGAIAIFNEKYGDVVRVVEVEGFSKEFCGGTHVENTSEIGVFRILSESSVGAGIRRIEAITSFEVLKHLEEAENVLKKVSGVLKVKTNFEIETKIRNVIDELKEKSEELDKFKLQFEKERLFLELSKNGRQIKNFRCVVFEEKILEKKQLRVLADCLKKKDEVVVALIFALAQERFNFLVVCGDGAVEKGADANEIVKKLCLLVNGKGGGKKDFAMAGVFSFKEKETIENGFFEILEKF